MKSQFNRLKASTHRIAFLAILFASLTVSAQQNSAPSTVPTLRPESEIVLEEKSYWLFFDQGMHMKELLAVGKFQEASLLYRRQNRFFDDRSPKYTAEMEKLAVGLNGLFAPIVDPVIGRLEASMPTDVASDWPATKTTFAEAAKLTEDLSVHTWIWGSTKAPLVKDRLESAIKAATQRWADAAGSAFAKFGINANFFDVYPVKIAERSTPIVQGWNTIRPQLKGSAAISEFRKTYDAEIKGNAELKKKVGDLLAEQILDGNKEPNRLKRHLAVIASAKDEGLDLGEVPGLTIAFAEATSQTLLKEHQIEFPVSVDVDIPIKIVKTSVDTALGSEKGQYDYLVVVDIGLAQTKQRIIKRDEIPSEFHSGTKTLPNPAYDQARMAVMESASALNSHNAQYCQGYGCLGKAIGGIALAVAHEEQKKKFSSIPMTLTENVYEDYKFSASDLDSTKVVTATYYVFDLKQNTYSKSVFDVSETKSFRIAYNLNQKDKNLSSHLSKYDNEDKVKKFEKADVAVKLSDTLNHYLGLKTPPMKIVSLTAVRDEMLKDKNRALAVYKDKVEQRSASTKDDPRFESVVVVHNPKGSLGTGFYIAPDLILTNYHVIEGAQFVEMKLRNGLETFGKVVKSDVRLDLAVVKVQARGKPVTFHSGSIQLGATVEAIGHPRGLDFTITRGVVSALRTRPSIFGVGGKEVLFVQTDTPINPGNSGGPLFLGDKVIAVNDNKIVGKGTEGIGFSIHFDEVKEFLKEVM
jgi:serine protease Do